MGRREAIEKMWREGKTTREIAAAQGLSLSGVSHYTKSLPSRWVWTRKRAYSKGALMGNGKDIPQETFDVVMKEMRGNETIIACMARLVASMSQKKEEPK